MPPPAASIGTSLTITNPLVLYRTLVATRQLQPDEAQHRLAIHLQKVYHRLKDYEPEPDYRARLEAFSPPRAREDDASAPPGLLTRLRGTAPASASQRALTRRMTSPEAARAVASPRGLLLHGEVGTGKSMLVDLLAESLPRRAKRRVHFSTFMLDAFARLERVRRERLAAVAGTEDGQSASLVLLARDLVAEAPVLFLDEFQLPDRAAARIVTNLFSAFFLMGGVLVATSNRLPEELDKAAGVEFARAPGVWGRVREAWMGEKGLAGNGRGGLSGGQDFSIFLEVLRARCEVWDMNGSRDWRRADFQTTADRAGEVEEEVDTGTGELAAGFEQGLQTEPAVEEALPSQLPSFYFVPPTSEESAEDQERRWTRAVHAAASSSTDSPANPIQWSPRSLTVYGRTLAVPNAHAGVTRWTFAEICGAALGPADYITLASTFHTVIVTDVPILTLLEKNEARRFITLLDALYESRCKLLVRAAAGPDSIFFPETQGSATPAQDATYAETFSEIFQDQTAPFRPNISAYESAASPPSYAPPAGNDPNRSAPSILADEDADFGPTYGAGRRHGGGAMRGPADGEPGAGHEIGHTPDFQRTSLFTGEDERFAYKRARSRLWEMCGSRWWARSDEGWWRPLEPAARHWERAQQVAERVVVQHAEKVVQDTTSPFRTSTEPPPKIPSTHAWGMTTWGKKAGDWGKGIEGLKERRKGEDKEERQ